MVKGQNPNKPIKGSSIKVQPITKKKDLDLIKRMLSDRPRDLCLFTLGINTNLRASDLIRITVGQVRHLQRGDALTLREMKTGKPRKVTLNGPVVESIQQLLKTGTHIDSDPLFRSRKKGQALTVPSVHRLVKGWCRDINLRGNYGSHTLRKTFGYMHRTVRKTDIPTLMQMFNHRTQQQTLDYLGIQPEEIKDAYLDLEL